MSEPAVTVIIAAPPGQPRVAAAEAARRLDWPAGRLEILIARGRQPSVQRNAAVRVAQGEWIYFLDDDSVPPPDNLRRVAALLGEKSVAMIGGPSLCPGDATPLQQSFAEVMASWLAFGPSRARYRSSGARRDTTEKELILCSLLARRDAFLTAGGFDEALYPNEENALMDALAKRGQRLVYEPAFTVERPPRATLRAFAKMLMNYGRGRAEQFRLHPGIGSVANFVPPLFVLYLAAAAVTLPLHRGWAFAPLVLYAGAVLAQTCASERRSPAHLLRVAALIPLAHVGYGLGFLRGLFTRPAPRPAAEASVFIERMTGSA